MTEESNDFECKWRHFLRVHENPWILDHKVQTTVLYPAAGVIAMVIEAMNQRFTKGEDDKDIVGFELLGLQLDAALIVPNDSHGLEVALQIKTPSQVGEVDGKNPSCEFYLASKPLHGPWRRNASGGVRLCLNLEGHQAADSTHGQTFKNLAKTCTQSISPRHLYEQLDIVGMNYGPLFRNIVSLSKSDSACIARIQVPDTRSRMPFKFEFPHIIHPATMDSMFQTLFALKSEPMVPHYIERVFVTSESRTTPGTRFEGFAKIEKTGARNTVATIDMSMDGWSHSRILVEGLRFTKISHPDPRQNTFLPNHRNLTSRMVWKPDTTSIYSKDLTEVIEALAHKYPSFSVLQIGGDVEIAKTILRLLQSGDNLPPRLTRYTISEERDGNVFDELSSSFTNDQVTGFLEKKPPTTTGEGLPTYNLVIVGLGHSVDILRLQSKLRPRGLLILHSTDPKRSNSFPYERVPFFYWAPGQVPGETLGQASLGSEQFHYLIAPRVKATVREAVLLVTGHEQATIWISAFCRYFLEIGVKLDVRDWSTAVECVKGKICIIAAFLSDETENDIEVWDEPTFYAFKTLQNLASGILWVTRSASCEVTAVGTSFLGLAQTLMSEDPSKRIVTLGLGNNPFSEDSVAKTSRTIFEESFCVQEHGALVETEYVSDDIGRIHIPRLKPLEKLNAVIHGHYSHDTITRIYMGDKEHRLELKIDDAGIEFGGLHWCLSPGKPGLAPDEVEVEFRAAALQAMDIRTLQGQTMENHLGLDIFGIVSAIGSNVQDLRAGDSVVGLTSDGTFRNRLRIHRDHVKKEALIPDGTDFPYTPSFYVSAYYAFVTSTIRTIGYGKQMQGVFIHGGASGYGRAAILLIRRVIPSVEVYTTVLGKNSDSQRKDLRQLGVPEERIFDGNSDRFARVLRRLAPLGVDIAYNTTQENIEACMQCVREGEFRDFPLFSLAFPGN
jgi:hypothetical protein